MTGLDPVVERARKGDEAAFNQLFRSHRDTVTRIVYRVLGPTPEAEVEDVVQDVFIHVFRSLKNFRGDARFTTWLYRLTTNVARMHIRKKRSRPRFSDVAIPERTDEADITDRPDAATDRGRRIEALYVLVQQLSEKKREVLVLHDFEGMPAKQIAEVVEAPVLTVRTRLFYARKELYAKIAADPSLAPAVEHLVGSLPGQSGAKAKKAQAKKTQAKKTQASEPCTPAPRQRRATGDAP
ncbi:MAG: sigma-70 family RNA polymerase sigma factor [Deltaproteobacteria bacterium]|nr:sigma-70 family RNA polymerase sigma factor [Deltaproteobacteria bacterium]